jgi:hypothetical protein
MHYNLIGDALKCASLISQYRRRALQTLVSHHVEKLRRVIRVARLALDDCLSYSDTIGDACLVRCVSDYRTPQVNFCRLSAASWSSPGFDSHMVPAEATSSHSQTKAYMDNTLIHKHIQKYKSI